MRLRGCAACAALLLLAPFTTFAADCAGQSTLDLVKPGALVIATHLTMPPQAFLDDGKPAGFAVEIGEAIAAQMCLKAEFVDLAFAGLFPGLNAKKFDTIVAGIGITPERRQSFDFVPYFEGGVRLVVRKDAAGSFRSEDDLCGFTVATQSGSTEAIALDRTNRETCPAGKKIEIMAYPNFNEAVQQLRKNVAQVAFVDWPFANYLAQAVPDLKLGSPILSGTPGKPRNQQGIVVRKGDSGLLDALAGALKEIQASGKYDLILAKWNVKEGDIRLVE